MNPLPIRLRLTVWYSVVLAVVLSVFGLSAYFEMRNSIHETVDESLRDRVGGVRGLIERNSPYGRDEVRRELREHSELAGGALLQVSDQQGDLLYRSASMNDLEIPIASRSFTGPFTFVSFRSLPRWTIFMKLYIASECCYSSPFPFSCCARREVGTG